MKIVLTPLDAKTARVLADRRGVTVDSLISSLLREEAAIEITNWRAQGQHELTPTPITATAQGANNGG